MSLTVAEIKDILEISSTSHDTLIAATLPLVSIGINDYCGGAFAHQVKEESITFTSAGASGYQKLTNNPVIRNTVVVTSTDRGVPFYGDMFLTDVPQVNYPIPSTYVEDYKLDYEGGRIHVPTTFSQILNNTTCTGTVFVTYAYVDLYGGAKIAAARLMQQHWTQPSGIGSESVGSLSRSYNTASISGYDPYVAALLAPYRKPRLI